MKPKDIDRFFSLLAKKIKFPLQIILTGGGAGILEGVERVTRDLDFQITLSKKSITHQEQFEKAVEGVAKQTRIFAQYDASIETWSSISWPESRPKSYLYRTFGCVEVRILDPLWWSIGKLARYLHHDISDVATVLRKMKIQPEQAARAWGKALGRSPMSSAQPIFKRQVTYFLKTEGPKVWGSSYKPERWIDLFLSTAQRAHRKS